MQKGNFNLKFVRKNLSLTRNFTLHKKNELNSKHLGLLLCIEISPLNNHSLVIFKLKKLTKNFNSLGENKTLSKLILPSIASRKISNNV